MRLKNFQWFAYNCVKSVKAKASGCSAAAFEVQMYYVDQKVIMLCRSYKFPLKIYRKNFSKIWCFWSIFFCFVTFDAQKLFEMVET